LCTITAVSSDNGTKLEYLNIAVKARQQHLKYVSKIKHHKFFKYAFEALRDDLHLPESVTTLQE
jgi:hypothetical protein